MMKCAQWRWLMVGLLGVCVLNGMASDAMAQRRRRPVVPGSPAVQLWSTANPTAIVVTRNLEKPFVYTEDLLPDLLKQYRQAMQEKKYTDALKALDKIPPTKWSPSQKKEAAILRQFQSVEQRVAKANAVISRDNEVDEPVKRQANNLILEAQQAILTGKNEVARDVLIHVLFLTGQNMKARYLMEDLLELKPDAYKVENMESKYWKRSEVGFYGGNYQQAVDALLLLSVLDRENPTVFERLGSAYYMMAEREKALAAWNTAVFLDDGNTALKETVAQLEKAIDEDKEAAKQARKAAKKDVVAVVADTIVLGKFNTQDKAYEFAAQVKKQGGKPVVAEEDGKWVVRAPKPQ